MSKNLELERDLDHDLSLEEDIQELMEEHENVEHARASIRALGYMLEDLRGDLRRICDWEAAEETEAEIESLKDQIAYQEELIDWHRERIAEINRGDHEFPSSSHSKPEGVSRKGKWIKEVEAGVHTTIRTRNPRMIERQRGLRKNEKQAA